MRKSQYLGYMYTILLVLLCLQSTLGQQHCLEPQKALYLSYEAQSKRDTIPGLFNEIDAKIGRYNYTYNDGKGATFVINNMHPQMYYNQHHQKENYIDPQHVNVTLGDIQFAFRMEYNITKPGGVKKDGWARGRVHVDQTAYFIKRLIIKDGYLEWDPTQAANLTITFPISIQYSEPTLEYQEKSAYQLILNDHAGDRKLRHQIVETFNQHYKVLLKEHLNKEDIINTMNIKYDYKNIRIPFINAIKNYTLSNNQIKGLQAFFFFEAENKTFNCTPDNIQISQKDYGGVQQIYSISSFAQAFKSALEQGLMDTTLDKKWQVPSFQLYMGDLANSVPYANYFPADDPFTVNCKWIRNNSNVRLVAYDFHELYAQVQELCYIEYKAKQVLQIKADISFVVRLYAMQDSISVVILGANVFSPEYKSIDPNFVVKDTTLARFAIQRILQGFEKQTTFGTGWKTSKRKFPSTHVAKDYIIVFDPSEV